jgi:hypothetical protein
MECWQAESSRGEPYGYNTTLLFVVTCNTATSWLLFMLTSLFVDDLEQIFLVSEVWKSVSDVQDVFFI